MKHAKRTVRNLTIGAVVLLPAVLADPAMQHFLSAHPALAGYLAGAAAVAEAVVHAVKGSTAGGA